MVDEILRGIFRVCHENFDGHSCHLHIGRSPQNVISWVLLSRTSKGIGKTLGLRYLLSPEGHLLEKVTGKGVGEFLGPSFRNSCPLKVPLLKFLSAQDPSFKGPVKLI